MHPSIGRDIGIHPYPPTYRTPQYKSLKPTANYDQPMKRHPPEVIAYVATLTMNPVLTRESMLPVLDRDTGQIRLVPFDRSAGTAFMTLFGADLGPDLFRQYCALC